MKSEMRREFARESFEEKIRKVGELIQLSARVKAERVREATEDSADVAYLKRARAKPQHSRPLDDYLREADLPPKNSNK
jgi:hypothetical protein